MARSASTPRFGARRRFLALGVDGVFVAGLKTRADYERVGRELRRDPVGGGVRRWRTRRGSPGGAGRDGLSPRVVSGDALIFRGRRDADTLAALRRTPRRRRDDQACRRRRQSIGRLLDDALDLVALAGHRGGDCRVTAERLSGDGPHEARADTNAQRKAVRDATSQPRRRRASRALRQRRDRRDAARARHPVHRADARARASAACTTASSTTSATSGPRMLLCVHEEHAVALAHGYARVTGRPMAVALHSNVGLMHATMAIFNAWCDRVPMLMLGGVGPIDAAQRRPWVDWIHTARDLGALVRGYTKWDDQPARCPAALEAILRALAASRMTRAARPDVRVPRRRAAGGSSRRAASPMPPLERFPPPLAGDPPADAVERDRRARCAKREAPLILIGRVPNDPADFDAPRRARRARSARACSPTSRPAPAFRRTHPLHPVPPGLFVTRRRRRAMIARRRRDPEPRLDRPRRHAAAGVRRRVAGRARHPVLARPVRAQRLEHGLPGAAAGRAIAAVRARRAGRALLDALARAETPRKPARAATRPQRRGGEPAAPARADQRPHVDRGAGRASPPSARAASPVVHPPAARLARRALPLRASARLHRLRRRRRHRLRARAWRSARRSRCAAADACPCADPRRRRLPDGRHRAVDRRALRSCRCW